MLNSMTGFGRCLVENAAFTQQWEIRSVNSRYLDLKWRLPQFVRCLEPRLEKFVRRHASRGRLEISLLLQFNPGHAPALSFDNAAANAVLDNLQALAEQRGQTFIPDYNQLLHVPSLWADPQYDQDDNLAAKLENALSIALEDWNESRAVEGTALGKDLLERVAHMEEWAEILSAKAPEIREDRIGIIRERLQELAQANAIVLEDARYLQEVVILTDKLDVSEELTRLFAHLDRLQQIIQQGGDAGRKLDFTLQECFREINTFGNKLPDTQLSPIVVDFKNELEKCREQVQNLE